MNLRWGLAAFASALLIGLGCGCQRRWGEPPSDAWLRQLPGGRWGGFEDVPRARFMVVPEAQQAEAQAALADRTYSVLPPEVAVSYGLVAASDKRAHGVCLLLRGVEVEPEGPRSGAAGKFVVQWKDRTAHVVYFAGLTRFTPARRRALAAILPAEPEEVFTSLSIVRGGDLGPLPKRK